MIERPPLGVPFTINRTHTLANGLVLWMPIIQYAWGKSDQDNNYSSSTVLDLVRGRRLQITPNLSQPAITFQADPHPKLGRILRYENINNNAEYSTWGYMPELEGVSQVSMSVWLKQFTSAEVMLVGWQDTSAGSEALAIEYWYDGYYYLSVSPDSGYASGKYYFGETNTDWHNVVMVFNGTQTGNANKLKGYVDGQQVTLDFEAYTIPAVTPTANKTLAQAKCGLINAAISSHDGNGGVCDIRYWNRALSDAEAKSIYHEPWALCRPTISPRYFSWTNLYQTKMRPVGGR